MKRIFVCLVFGLIANGVAQSLEPPVNYDITSDYGPRDVTNGTWFHEAIDYAAPMWTPVEAVEEGNISDIGYQTPPENGSSGGWYIKVSTGARTWAYLHLSTDVANDNPISPDTQFEIKFVTLENAANPVDIKHQYVFIFWFNRGLKKAQKVLAFLEPNKTWYVY
ncbi:MAG: hypothetical protein NTX59_08040 [Elusimicrobia bacterium]|nr:hypothetical protein [Elusimicrobiota bacterium]